jgi:hypothetical protein
MSDERKLAFEVLSFLICVNQNESKLYAGWVCFFGKSTDGRMEDDRCE